MADSPISTTEPRGSVQPTRYIFNPAYFMLYTVTESWFEDCPPSLPNVVINLEERCVEVPTEDEARGAVIGKARVGDYIIEEDSAYTIVTQGVLDDIMSASIPAPEDIGSKKEAL